MAYLENKIQGIQPKIENLVSSDRIEINSTGDNSYKIELFDGQGHKYSKKNAFSSGTSKKEAKANKKESKKPETEQKLQGGEYQVFTESWQKIIFTDSDFESQGKTDTVKKFFGINGNSKNKKDITQTCAVIVINSTGKDIENLKFTTENTRLEITDENRITKNLIEKADDKVHYIWNGTKNTASKVVNFVSNKINKKDLL